jgi:hypothetical protein
VKTALVRGFSFLTTLLSLLTKNWELIWEFKLR